MKKYLLLLSISILFYSCNDAGTSDKPLKPSQIQMKDKILYQKGSKIPYTGEIVTNYPNGPIKSSFFYVNGVRDGATTYYSQDGTLLYEKSYKDGKLDGKYKSYYENGNLKIEANVENGIAKGEVKGFYDDKKVMFEGVVEKVDKVSNYPNEVYKVTAKGKYHTKDGKVEDKPIQFQIQDASII